MVNDYCAKGKNDLKALQFSSREETVEGIKRISVLLIYS